jgi:vitamin B12 transporter
VRPYSIRAFVFGLETFKTMKSPYVVCALLGALALPCATHAQNTPYDDETIVTISRHPVPLKTVAQTVFVIDADRLRHSASGQLADVLQGTPSTHIITYGGTGQTASVSIRGAGTDHTLILLDGVRLNDPSLVGGGSDNGLINTIDVDHIEVLRGPFSTVWGSSALGGVISLTTKQAIRPLETQLSLFGLGDYYRAHGSLGGKADDVTWRISSQRLSDRGISAFDSGAEKDGYTQTQTSAQAQYRLQPKTTLFAYAQQSHSRTDFDGLAPPTFAFGDSGDYGKSQTTLVTTGLKHKGDWGDFQLSLGQTTAKRRNYDDQNALTFVSRGVINSLDGVINLKLKPESDLLLGFGTREDAIEVAAPSSFDSNPAPLRATQREDHVFALYRRTLNHHWQVDLGGRYEKIQKGKDIVVGQLGVLVPLSAHLTLRTGIGSGYKTPSLFQLFSEFGNEALRPERAQNGEIGLDYRAANVRLSLLYYDRTIKDLIGFASCFGLSTPICATRPFGYYDNIQKAQSRGVEFGFDWRVQKNLTLNANASLQSNQNRSDGFANRDLARTPNTLLGLRLDYEPNARTDISLATRYSGKSFDDAANRVLLKAYILTDLIYTYRLRADTQLQINLDNVGDVHYQTVKDYGQTGRRLWLGVRFNR